MEKIASFKIDHTRLLRGIYVSRKDYMQGGDVVTTFDIRMKLPNREPAVSQSALHTIEHLAATYLRNHQQWGDKVVYWGPMGCCTSGWPTLTARFPEPMPMTAATIHSITCPWPSGSHVNSTLRFSRTSRKKTWSIRQSNPSS